MKGWKERRAYVALILIFGIMCGGVLLLGLREAHDNKTRTCAVISIIISTPAVKPSTVDPDPLAVRSYTNYLKFKKLNEKLSC